MDSGTLGGRLADHYNIGKVLGTGGFSTVRQGVDRKTGALVALKILKPFG